MFDLALDTSDFWKEIHEQPIHIERAFEKNKEAIQKLIFEVKEKKIDHIMLVGRGSSEHALQVARIVCEVYVGIPASICSPSNLTQYKGKLDLSHSLTIGVSQCGEAQDVYAVLRECEKQGGISLSITNEANCLMRKISHYMNCGCGKELSFTAGKSYICQVVILVSIMLELGGKDSQQWVCDAIDICKETLCISDKIKEVLPLFRNVNNICILGRGYSYAVGLEAELKIQEASYTNARVYSSADYQHGPIAATDRFTPFIVYLTDENTNKTTVDLVVKLKEIFHISTFVITNKKEYCSLGDSYLMIPKKAEGIHSIVADVVVSQVFACMLSFARGYHPDKPTCLSKVTVTF